MLIIDYNIKLLSKSNEKQQNQVSKYFLSRKYKEFEAHVRSGAIEKYPGFKPFSCNISFLVTAYFKNKTHIDIVNAGKSLTDSLEGVLYYNDRQIKDIHGIVKSEKWHTNCFTIFIDKLEE